MLRKAGDMHLSSRPGPAAHYHLCDPESVPPTFLSPQSFFWPVEGQHGGTEIRLCK